jgi:Skp family chaperone for outer membrane proteins
MKKVWLIALTIMVSVGFSGILYADNIGFVDVEQLLVQYKEAQKFQKEVQEKREEYQEFFVEKQKKLEKEKEKGKSDEDMKKLVAEIEVDLKERQEALFQMESQFQRVILAQVTEVSKKVAKEYGIDVVIDKRVVFVGGFDLTTFVLEELNQ